MRYDIKLLEKGLADVIKERDDMIGRSFPFIYQEELDSTFKVDAFANKRALKLESYAVVSARFARGENMKALADEYEVSYKTIQRAIKKYRKDR